ncbi:Mu-like prophage major head subunit gpT family protein [Kribbella qitaiheensis]|uniref:phage major capsid protein n=1 Tax=Kribbella qitaiheensis TaxID=1544730 RepID=UPI0036208549
MTITIDPVEVVSGQAANDTVAESSGRRLRGRYSNERLHEGAVLMGRVFDGSRRAMLELEEAMSTSDFAGLFGAVMDHALLQAYEVEPQVWSQFAARRVLKDFKVATLHDILGGRAILPEVAELTEYPARPVTETPYTLRVGKRGARISLSWETFVNDDLDAFKDLPNRLAQAARNTEDYLATGAIEVAGAPNPAFFTSGNGNLMASGTTSALSVESLTTAITALSNVRDSEGLPVLVSSVVLVVPPALQITAQKILNATELRYVDATTNRTMITTNILAGAVRLVTNRWLTNATAWYLLPDPNAGTRFSVGLGFLRGHEVPDLRIKSDGGSRVGGGEVAPTEGSFDIDDVQYRVRHVIGAATADPKGTWASPGA